MDKTERYKFMWEASCKKRDDLSSDLGVLRVKNKSLNRRLFEAECVIRALDSGAFPKAKAYREKEKYFNKYAPLKINEL